MREAQAARARSLTLHAPIIREEGAGGGGRDGGKWEGDRARVCFETERRAMGEAWSVSLAMLLATLIAALVAALIAALIAAML
jgi:hypothetical protein